MFTTIQARREEGFTLIELLMVVLIIGILAAIAIPVYNGQKNNAKNAAAQTAVRTAIDAVNLLYNQNGESYTSVTTATINAAESSISATAQGILSQPSSSSDPTQIWVGCPGTSYNPGAPGSVTSFNGGTNPCGAVATATPTASTIFICDSSKGTTTYCAEGVNGKWTLDKGTGTTASNYASAADVIAIGADGNTAVITGATAGSSFSATGW